MCVIIAKDKNTKAPAIKTMEAATIANPHGFSIAWAKEGKLEVFKTLDREEFLAFYKANIKTLNAVPFVFHARYATHGSKNINNCHGWLFDEGKRAFFHNGVLDLKNRGDLTDSETFLRDIYEPIFKYCGEKEGEKAIHAIIGASKFAIIKENGHIKLYGRYINEGEVYYSNQNFKWAERKTYKYSRNDLFGLY